MSLYQPLKVKLLELAGVDISLRAMRLPKNQSATSTLEADFALAGKLIKAGDDHAKAIRGIIAYLEIEMQVGFMIEFETYRHGVECLSTSSSMHNELKGLNDMELVEAKQAGLPTKVYTRILTMSYQALRNIYLARRYHRHHDWKLFTSFIEDLPLFNQLIYPEGRVSTKIKF